MTNKTSARILVVDDDNLVRLTTARLLRNCGYTVEVAENGRDALSLMNAFRPDLVLCDVMMPDMEGPEVCRRIKSNPAWAGTYVILLSNLRTDSDTVSKALEETADSYIGRPIAARELQARVKAALRVREAESKLAKAEKMAALGRVIGGIAHQFNNINTVLAGQLELLKLDPELSAKSLTRVEHMRKALNREIDITEKLLLYAQKQSFEPVEVDLADAIDQCILAQLQRIAQDGIAVSLDLEPGVVVVVDQVMLDHVLEGLIDNACHACIGRDVRELVIWARAEDDMGVVSVRDSGHGIADRDRDIIFQPFFSRKGEHADADSPWMELKGLGLTLSVSLMVIQAQGGSMDFASQVGAGTTFTFRLPLAVPSPEAD